MQQTRNKKSRSLKVQNFVTDVIIYASFIFRWIIKNSHLEPEYPACKGYHYPVTRVFPVPVCNKQHTGLKCLLI